MARVRPRSGDSVAIDSFMGKGELLTKSMAFARVEATSGTATKPPEMSLLLSFGGERGEIERPGWLGRWVYSETGMEPGP